MPHPAFAIVRRPLVVVVVASPVLLLGACRTETSPTTVVIPPAPSSSAGPPTPVQKPAATPVFAGAEDTCRVDSDCDWGEIDQEIQKSDDCMCLLGCPHIIQNKTTQERRQAQYHRFCKPGMDGKGNGCPIDDCAAPPPLKCVAGTCRSAPRP